MKHKLRLFASRDTQWSCDNQAIFTESRRKAPEFMRGDMRRTGLAKSVILSIIAVSVTGRQSPLTLRQCECQS